MARFHITSDPTAHHDARVTCDEAKLEPAGSVENDNLYLTTYEKRVIDTTNFLRTDDDDFVAVTGTLIINGKLGERALRELHEVYKESGVTGVRNQSFGQYAVLIKDGDTVTIFSDPNGVYKTYYTDDDSWFVSNSLSLCAESLDRRVIDRYAFYRHIIEGTELSSATLYQDVSRLAGREKLVLDIPADDLSIERIPYPDDIWSYADASFGEILEEYTARAEAVFSEISEATDRIGIQATGGLDSRTVLAGVLQQGDQPLLLYGVGNSKITNTKDEDLQIVNQYADRYDLPFYQMDWSGEYPISTEVWKELFRKYGFRVRIYSATPNFFAEFEEGFPGNPELLLNGYGFGIVSNVYYWEDESIVPISFEDVVTDVFTCASGFSDEAFECKDEYLDRLVSVCEEVMDEFDRDIDIDEPLDMYDFTRTAQQLKGRPQSPYTNIVNEFTYHLSPFSTYELGQPMIDVPSKYRSGERLRVKLLKNIYPDLLNVPIYSGTRKRKFTDSDEMELVTSERLISTIGALLPEPAVEIVRPVYERMTDSSYEDIDDIIYEEYARRVDDDGIVDDCFTLEKSDVQIRRHSRFPLFEMGITEIGYDAVKD